MAQMEIGTFHFTHTNNPTNYIDLTKSDAVANCKAKYQFKNGRPLAYLLTVRFSNAANEVRTIPTGWVQTNALVKTAASWMEMNRKAGLTKRDLNTYGKEIRLPINKEHKTQWGNKNYELLADGLPGTYDTGVNDADGDEYVGLVVTNDPTTNPIGKIFAQVFENTVITIPDSSASADPIDWEPFVLADGTSSSDKTDSVIYQYITSRGSVDVEDEDLSPSEGMVSTNYLIQALAENEQSSDDVIENVRDYGDFRPYSLENTIQTRTKAVAASTNVAGQDTSFVAPLGLLEWDGSDQDVMSVTVSAIVEM